MNSGGRRHRVSVTKRKRLPLQVISAPEMNNGTQAPCPHVQLALFRAGPSSNSLKDVLPKLNTSSHPTQSPFLSASLTPSHLSSHTPTSRKSSLTSSGWPSGAFSGLPQLPPRDCPAHSGSSLSGGGSIYSTELGAQQAGQRPSWPPRCHQHCQHRARHRGGSADAE